MWTPSVKFSILGGTTALLVCLFGGATTVLADNPLSLQCAVSPVVESRSGGEVFASAESNAAAIICAGVAPGGIIGVIGQDAQSGGFFQIAPFPGSSLSFQGFVTPDGVGVATAAADANGIALLLVNQPIMNPAPLVFVCEFLPVQSCTGVALPVASASVASGANTGEITTGSNGDLSGPGRTEGH